MGTISIEVVTNTTVRVNNYADLVCIVRKKNWTKDGALAQQDVRVCYLP